MDGRLTKKSAELPALWRMLHLIASPYWRWQVRRLEERREALYGAKVAAVLAGDVANAIHFRRQLDECEPKLARARAAAAIARSQHE